MGLSHAECAIVRSMTARNSSTRHATKPAPATRDSLARIQRDIIACQQCPRLIAWCQEVAQKKRRAYLDWDYWGRPVPSFGDTKPGLWILGLAPAAHGANRTGRMFTGDSSGDWLYAAMHRAGFASQPQSVSRDDGQKVIDAWITAAVHCAPPDNKPLPAEVTACAPYLDREWAVLRNLQVVLALGGIAFNAFLKLLQRNGWEVPRPKPRFGHLQEYTLTRPNTKVRGPKQFTLLASYHPSRQNTQTGRLTRQMWQAVFDRARTLLQQSKHKGR
jgi:uracil-DNA glycosylase family 4